MTKEELEREAETYWINQPPFTEIKDRVIQAYIDCAEPREKRIAELEKENTKFKKYCAKYERRISKIEKGVCDICKEIEKDKKLEGLEKENFFLKEKLTGIAEIIGRTVM